MMSLTLISSFLSFKKSSRISVSYLTCLPIGRFFDSWSWFSRSRIFNCYSSFLTEASDKLWVKNINWLLKLSLSFWDSSLSLWRWNVIWSKSICCWNYTWLRSWITVVYTWVYSPIAWLFRLMSCILLSSETLSRFTAARSLFLSSSLLWISSRFFLRLIISFSF